MGAGGDNASEVFEQVGDGGRASISGILGDVPVDPEPRCEEPLGSLGDGHAGLADHVSDDISNSPFGAERWGVSLLRGECLEEFQKSVAFLVHVGPDIDHLGHGLSFRLASNQLARGVRRIRGRLAPG